MIELNELELTNASRFSEDEIRVEFMERAMAEAKQADSKTTDVKAMDAKEVTFRNIIPGDIRGTQLFLNTHRSQLQEIAARANGQNLSPASLAPAACADVDMTSTHTASRPGQGFSQ